MRRWRGRKPGRSPRRLSRRTEATLWMALALGVLLLAIPGLLDGLSDRARAVPYRLMDRDCADFATRAEATAFFRATGPGDPHHLDSDVDGKVCEWLP